MTLQLTKDGIFLSLIESPTLNEREVYIDFGSLKTSVHPDTGRRRTRFVRNASAIVKGKWARISTLFITIKTLIWTALWMTWTPIS